MGLFSKFKVTKGGVLVKYTGKEKFVTVPEGVISIGGGAFRNNTALTSVTLPHGVREIGKEAFLGCTSLVEVLHTDEVTGVGVAAFCGCHALPTLSLPAATHIENDATRDCPALTRLVLHHRWRPNAARFSVAKGGDPLHVFLVDGNILHGYVGPAMSASVPAGLSGAAAEEYLRRARVEVAVPSGIAYIADEAFRGCKNLAAITLPTGLMSIGASAFVECDVLASVHIPESVTMIGESAFYGCASLASVSLPEGLTSLGRAAFADCASLTSVRIPGGVRTLSGTFEKCRALTSVTVAEGVGEIGFSTFHSCFSLKSVALPSALDIIQSSAFEQCTSLTEITIPAGVKKICRDAFFSCTSLTTLTLAGATTEIEGGAFKACPLVSVYLPIELKPRLADIFGAAEAMEISFLFCDYEASPTADFDFDGNTVIKYKGTAQEVRIPLWVTRIGDNAFQKNTVITSVTIPEGVTDIRPHAFECCKNLRSMTIPGSVTTIDFGAFSGCEELVTLVLSEGVGYIGPNAFAGCRRLAEVHIPASVHQIDDNAFGIGCDALERLSVAPGNQRYYSAGNCIIERTTGTVVVACNHSVIPSDGNVRAIGRYAFRSRTALSAIAIPEGVTKIEPEAFEDCTALTAITFPRSVSEIGAGALAGCTALERIAVAPGNTTYFSKDNCVLTRDGTLVAGCKTSKIPTDGSIRTIGCGAFHGHPNATVFIPGGVETIATYAFRQCTGLTYLSFPITLKSVEWSAFEGCSGLTELTLPATLKKIDVGTFSGCKGLKKITIPDGVTEIGGHAFANCEGLTELVIPDGVTEIGGHAFANCEGLTELVIPESVTTIGDNAFRGCTALASVTLSVAFKARLGDIFDPVLARKPIFTFSDEAPPITFPPEFSVENGVLLSYTGKGGEVRIPEGVTAIDDEAFSADVRVSAVHIPATVTAIEEAAFADMPYLASISVAADNPAYRVADGALYTKDMSVLLQYPVANRNTSYTAPKTLRRVGKGAFYYCRELHYVTLGNVTEIGDAAFLGCMHLFSLTATAEEIEVGADAFAECQKLERVDAPALMTKKDVIFPDSRV